MNPVIEKMYSDYWVVEDIRETIDFLDLSDLSDAIVKWNEASKKIEGIIPRVALSDIDAARNLMDTWKFTLSEKNDFRVLSYRLSHNLIPALISALNVLYGPIEMEGNKYSFFKSDSGFINVRDNETEKYLHDLEDPMHEALVIAKKVYTPEMNDFHILGCGLGYLAYQIWKCSEKSAHMYIYEDDNAMLEYASQFGVLSMIDPECLTIADNSDVDKMILEFYKVCQSEIPNRYISDWKVGNIKDSKNANIIAELDFNERTRRFFGIYREINYRENKKQASFSFESIIDTIGTIPSEMIVVSAGPSLNDNIDFIRKSAGEKLIICINAALKRLQAEEIIPDIAVALDPKKTLSSHIDGIEEFTEKIPLVMTSGTSYTFVRNYRGPKYVLNDNAKTTNGFEWCFGGTVASFALDIAYYLGAKKIYLVGSDLAFSENRNYADGVAHGINEGMTDSIIVDSTDGGKVSTTRLYNKYRETIEDQIRLHPDTTVINLARHGAKIAGTHTL